MCFGGIYISNIETYKMSIISIEVAEKAKEKGYDILYSTQTELEDWLRDIHSIHRSKG